MTQTHINIAMLAHVDARSTTKEKLGLLMTGSGEEKQANE